MIIRLSQFTCKCNCLLELSLATTATHKVSINKTILQEENREENCWNSKIYFLCPAGALNEKVKGEVSAGKKVYSSLQPWSQENRCDITCGVPWDICMPQYCLLVLLPLYSWHHHTGVMLVLSDITYLMIQSNLDTNTKSSQLW